VISQDTINQVRERANIVQVVGERVKLERAGRSFKGLCPFHKEKTPSFHVNEERNFYHCFGCHASGDCIRFVQETEGLSFSESIRELASRLGIVIQETRSDVDRRQDQEADRRQKELYAVNEAAASAFERFLHDHPLRQFAWQELERRQLLPQQDNSAIADTLKAFRIGYAPYGWDALGQALKSAGLSHVAAETVGLLAPRRSGPGHYDRFRHRLMFAIVDLRGRVVGFSGRSLPQPEAELLTRHGLAAPSAGEEPAKYINSPESPVYKKRDMVFGLYQARNAVRQQDDCVLVEGNFDVVSLHARGIDNVVAPLGTAFTQEQAAQIRRYTQRVTLLFDADGAGRRASVAAREPCQAEGLLPRVASLPSGTDPDDFVRSRGADALRQALKSARGMLEYLIDQSLDSGFTSGDPETQGRKIQEVLELIKTESDPTVRALAQTHADHIATRLGIHDVRSMQALSRAVRQAGAPPPTHERSADPGRIRSRVRYEAIESIILSALVEHPALLDDAAIAELMKYVSGALALAIAVLQQNPHDPTDRLALFPDELRQVVAESIAAPTLDDPNVARRLALENLGKLAAKERRIQKAEFEAELRKARSTGDQGREVELLTALQRLASQRVGGPQ
jgi:DNA primase